MADENDPITGTGEDILNTGQDGTNQPQTDAGPANPDEKPVGHSGLPIEQNQPSATSHANEGVPTVKPSLVDRVARQPKRRVGPPEEKGNAKATLAESGPDGGEAPESVDESEDGDEA